MAKVSALKLDTWKIDGLSEKLAGIQPERLGDVLVGTLNEVGERAYKLSRADITRTINLKESYVDRLVTEEKATKNRPVYEITAEFNATNVSHYGAVRLQKQVNWTNSQILAKRGKFDEKWPGWVERKGTRQLGIAPNKKQAGASVAIKKGARIAAGEWFSIPGRKDKDGKPLVFRQNAGGKVEAVIGPSPYQLFRRTIKDLSDQIFDDLEKSILDGAEREILRNL